jgi:hypothetical protein
MSIALVSYAIMTFCIRMQSFFCPIILFILQTMTSYGASLTLIIGSFISWRTLAIIGRFVSFHT